MKTGDSDRAAPLRSLAAGAGRRMEALQGRCWEGQPEPPLRESAFNPKPEEVERRLLAHELEIARNIQQSLLPKSFPALPGFGLAGFCESARHVGGDFFDILPLDEGSVLLVVADVMGKGVPAALFAATLRTLIRTLAEWTSCPGELLARINRLMYQELSSVDMFITVQLALADVRQGCLRLASAGHCPLLLTNCRGEPSAISPDGMPLGILPEAVFTEATSPLEPSGCALLYTDGLTDARNPDGDLFGQARLEDWLCKNVKPSQTADQLKEDFLAELRRFQSDVSAIDDLTFLILAGEAHQAGAMTPKTADAAPAIPAPL